MSPQCDYSSSSSSEDDIMNYPSLKYQSSAKKLETEIEQTRECLPRGKDDALKDGGRMRSSPRLLGKQRHREDEDIAPVLALSKAMAAVLPSGIKSTKQLFWYKDMETRYYPCRVCERGESRIYLNLEAFWDDAESCLIQALDFPPSKPFGGKDRIVVNRTLLIPFNGNKSAKLEWNRALFSKYTHGRKLEARRLNRVIMKSDLDATYPYLERIRQAASETEVTFMDETMRHDDTNVGTENENDSDMETPYNENVTVGAEFRLQDFSDKKMEPLRPGDIIQYTSPIFVAGDRRGRRQAKVLSTDPNRDPMLVLENGDILPENIIIKRVQVMVKGTHHPHHGCARRIEKFILKKRALKGDFSMRAGMKKEANRIGRVYEKNIQTFQRRAEADGFAPMDLMNNYGPRNGIVLRSHAQGKKIIAVMKPTMEPSDLMDPSSESEQEISVTTRPAMLTKNAFVDHYSNKDFPTKSMKVSEALQKTKTRAKARSSDPDSMSLTLLRKPHVALRRRPSLPSSDSDSDSSFDSKTSRRLVTTSTKLLEPLGEKVENAGPLESKRRTSGVNILHGASKMIPDKEVRSAAEDTRDDDARSDSDSSLEALQTARQEMASTQQQRKMLDDMNAALEFTNSRTFAKRKTTSLLPIAGLSFTKQNVSKRSVSEGIQSEALTIRGKAVAINATKEKAAMVKSPAPVLIKEKAATSKGRVQALKNAHVMTSPATTGDGKHNEKTTDFSSCVATSNDDLLERAVFCHNSTIPSSRKLFTCMDLVVSIGKSPIEENFMVVNQSSLPQVNVQNVNSLKDAEKTKKRKIGPDDDNLSFQSDSQDIRPPVLQVNQSRRKEPLKKFDALQGHICAISRSKFFGVDNDDLWDSSDTDHRMQRKNGTSEVKRLKRLLRKRPPLEPVRENVDHLVSLKHKNRDGRVGGRSKATSELRGASRKDEPPLGDSSLSSLSGVF